MAQHMRQPIQIARKTRINLTFTAHIIVGPNCLVRSLPALPILSYFEIAEDRLDCNCDGSDWTCSGVQWFLHGNPN
jgi:hypothetical protein